MALSKSFTTVGRSSDPMRPTLVKRALKRKVRAKTDPNWWDVGAISTDAYDSYDVHLREDGSWWCSCEGTTGGEYRRTCSHKTAVLLYRETHPDPWDDLTPSPDAAEPPNSVISDLAPDSLLPETQPPEIASGEEVGGKGSGKWQLEVIEDPEGQSADPSPPHDPPMTAEDAPGDDSASRDDQLQGAGPKMGVGGIFEVVESEPKPDRVGVGAATRFDVNPKEIVARSTEQSPDLASPVVVVENKIVPVGSTTDGTGSTLPHEQSMPTPLGKVSAGGVPAHKGTLADEAFDPFDPFDLDYDNPPIPQSIAGPLDSQLPAKFAQFRLSQWRGIIETIEALDNGVKCVFLSAPTGSGKSAIGATIPQIMDIPYIYCCTTHVLQGQIIDDFHYAALLKGKRNYPTHDNPEEFPTLTADDCTMERLPLPACPSCVGWKGGIATYIEEKSTPQSHCHHCHFTMNCPYRQAKDIAANSRMAVLNTAYFLAETNYAEEGSMFANRQLVVIDEADTLEKELMGFITVDITAGMRKRLGVSTLPKKTVADSWVEWVRDTLLPATLTYLKDNPPVYDLFGKPDMKTQRNRGAVSRLRDRLKDLMAPPPLMDDDDPDSEPDPSTTVLSQGWVLEGSSSDDLDPYNSTITFKPITVRNYAQDVLWDKADQFILMSATIISPEQMAYDLGLDDGEWAVVEVPSSFPKEQRPVVVRGETTVTHKTTAIAHPIITRQVIEIADQFPDYRILVHSNSYKLTKDIFYDGRKVAREGVSRYISYFSPTERQPAIDRYLASDNGILIAPSLDRGIDLADDLARIIVIAKVPYLSLGDRQVSARLYGTGKWGKTWYCLAPGTRVLRNDDLRWVPIENLMEGDGVVGFTEDGPHRRLQPSKVEATRLVRLPTYRMILADGTEFLASSSHKWLTQNGSLNNSARQAIWRTTNNIAAQWTQNARKYPIHLLRITDTWEDDHSWEAGYLAGLLDGEGSLVQIPDGAGFALRVSWAQMEGIVADKTERIAKELGFSVGRYERKTANDPTLQFTIKGGRSEALRLLGQIRPSRLLDKFDPTKLTGQLQAKPFVPVEHVEFVGVTELVGVQSSTRTFLAEGFASHNSTEAIKTIVQMTGRGMRHKDDWSLSIILDRQFIKLFYENQKLFPKWWREAVVFDENDPRWRDVIKTLGKEA